MIFYKTKPPDDPYYDLWNSPEWLFPFENMERLTFPKILTVEPVNVCQNSCIYCGMRLMDRKTGSMLPKTMEKIAEEASRYGASVRFGGFGEPLIHKDITSFVKMCKDRGVRSTIFTNARFLTEDMMRKLCDIGLDEIRFSSAGISEAEHREIRKNSDWNRDFMDKVLMAKRVRDKAGSKKPYLALFSIVFDYENPDFKSNLDAYVNKFLNYVDKVDIDLINLSRVKDLDEIKCYYPKSTIKKIYKPCVTLYHKMLIHWNGDVFACDVLYNYHEDYYCGNIDKGITIYQMYHSPKVNRLREMTRALRHGELEFCKACYQNTYKYEPLKEKYRKGAAHEI